MPKEISRRTFLITAGAAALASFVPESVYAQNSGNAAAYPHLREWSYEEFGHYSDWVENFWMKKRHGKANASEMGAKLKTALKSDSMNSLNQPSFLGEGNPQLPDSTLASMQSVCDCGKFTMLLPLYYAYRRGLPFAVGGIKSQPYSGSAGSFIMDAMSPVYSHSHRNPPSAEGTISVPVKISREFLVPGTIGYDPRGHGLVVSKVDENGEVHFLDSHPDQSISFSKTTNTLNIFKPWGGYRQVRLAKLENGVVRLLTNQEMIPFGFSGEQYELGISDLPSFVRQRLRMQGKKENPLEYMARASEDLVNTLRERDQIVQEAWKDILANGAIAFPNGSNIYQATGRWETWSSPSSDGDRRKKYDAINLRLGDLFEGFPSSEEFDYAGFSTKQNLAQALLERKQQLFSEEKFTYKHSSGREVTLTLEDFEKRMWDFSFNPSLPPELRWGAPEGTAERQGMRLMPCPVSGKGTMNALEAYRQEKPLHFYTERQPGAQHLGQGPSKAPFQLINKTLEKYLR